MPYHTPETLPPTFICRRLRIPNDIGFLMAVNGALAELAKEYNWEQVGAVTPEQARAAMLDMLLDTLDSECPDETPEPGEKLVFTPDASLITYAPQDPFSASEIVPPGYVFAPLYEVGEGVIPFPGVQIGDVLTDLAKLPTVWPPLLPPDGYPRFRVNFHVTGPGPGEVELHLVKLPLAGLALVTLDGDPGTADFIDLATADVLDLANLAALLGTVLDGDLVRTHIQELQIAEPGDHFIDVTFLPKIGTSSLVGFGGGLRQVVLGGTAEAGSMPAPQFRLTGTILEWRPHDAHVWLELGDLGAAPGEGSGIQATEVVELGYDQPPSLVFNPENGRLTLSLPVGFPPDEPDILTTSAQFIDRNANPLLGYDPETKALVMGIPDKWIVGIRQNPTTPSILEILEKQNVNTSPQQWTPFANLGTYQPTAIPPAPQVAGDTMAQKRCLAAHAATEVLRRTYTEIGERVVGEALDSFDLAQAITLAGAGILSLGATLIGQGAGLLGLVLIQDQFALHPWDSTFGDLVRAGLFLSAQIDENGIVTWDADTVAAQMDAFHLIDLDQRWMNLKQIVWTVGADGLNAAGSVNMGLDPDVVCVDLCGECLDGEPEPEPECNLVVYANSQLTSPVTVAAGDVLNWDVVGTWRYNTGSFYDPDDDNAGAHVAASGYPLPGGRVAWLVVRPGASGTWFRVKTGVSWTVPEGRSGTLYFRINDGGLGDNSGSLNVKVIGKGC